MPSAFNALFTIRPSTLRIPYGKATNSMLGQESIRSVCGPMCRSIASVEYFMRVVLDACPADFDATAFPFPYNRKLYDTVSSYKKLAFGYAKTDGHVHPVTPAIRAMDETIAALKAAGHEGKCPLCYSACESDQLAYYFIVQCLSSTWRDTSASGT